MADERYNTTITKSYNAPSTNAPSTNAIYTTKSNIEINLLDFKDEYKYILKTRLR